MCRAVIRSAKSYWVWVIFIQAYIENYVMVLQHIHTNVIIIMHHCNIYNPTNL